METDRRRRSNNNRASNTRCNHSSNNGATSMTLYERIMGSQSCMILQVSGSRSLHTDRVGEGVGIIAHPS